MDYNYEEYFASLVNEVKKEKKIKYENNLSVKEDMKVSFVEKEESKKTFTSKETFHENDKKSKEIILKNEYSSKGIFSTGESKEAIIKNSIPIETVIVEEYRDTMLFNTNSIDSYAIQKSDSNLTYNFNNLEKEDKVTTAINSYEVGFINSKPTLGISYEIDYIDVKLDKSLSSGNFIQEKPTLEISYEIDYIDVKLDKSFDSGNFIQEKPTLGISYEIDYIDVKLDKSLSSGNFIQEKPTLEINHEIDYIDVKLDKSLSSGKFIKIKPTNRRLNESLSSGNFIQEKPTLEINHEIDYIDAKLDKSLSSGNFVLGRNDFITGDINNGFVSSKSGTTVINAGGAVSQSLENAYGKYSNLQSDINKSSSVAGTISTVAKELEFQFSSVTDKGIESWLSDKIGKMTDYPSWSYRVGFDNISNLFNGFAKLGGEASKEQIDSASLINTAISAFDFRNIKSMRNPFSSKERYNKGRHDLLINEKNTAGVFDSIVASKGRVLTTGLGKNIGLRPNPLFSNLEEGMDEKYEKTIISPKKEKNLSEKISEYYIAKRFDLRKRSFYIEGKIKEGVKEKELVDLYNEINNSMNNKSIGYIYVNPVYADIIRRGSKLIKIPIQTNLKISGDNLRAEYNKIDFLNRIGSVAQYTRTESRTSEIETSYFVETTDASKGRYTMKDLQNIEYLYKSLLVPQRVSETKNEKTFNYMTRPPVINIVIGDDNSNNDIKIAYDEAFKDGSRFDKNIIINNFFTYPIIENPESGKGLGKLYYRSFVATDLSIEKETDTSTFYIGEDGSPLDYSGFTVRLSLLEIDPNYLGVNPTFDDYALFGVRGAV